MRCATIAGVLAVLSSPCWSADQAAAPWADVPLRISPRSSAGIEPEAPTGPRADVFVNGVTTFDTMQDALGHCPGNPVIWVPTLVNPLHPDRSAIAGAYMCQADASLQFARPQ